MAYTAPTRDMDFVITELCDFDRLSALPGYEDASADMVSAILEEAGKYASNVLSPLNRVGDLKGACWKDGDVVTPDEWHVAYDQLVEMGWNAPSASPEHGGMGLPNVVNACIQEMFQGANMAFQLCPMLTQGAIEALEGYASEELKARYLGKLVTGEWTGTMNLTEPQAGSDLSAVRSTATPSGDHFLVKGQKIFITYGEHDLTDNIIHLVLARLPDAPAGVKGISLFVVPKVLENGERNDVACASIEHKLGIHGSPTATLIFGEQDGAIGYLVGEPNRGLEYMFAMMNNARLNVGIQGIGVGEHAAQDALAYALERRQGGKAIAEHADVRRMLNLMKSQTDTARILACRAAAALDFVAKSQNEEERAFYQRRVDLLIPVVKGYSTEKSVEITSLGVQIHGGMGFVEETGVAQHFRDARITPIYEGTTGIQALDLVGRKILRDNGTAVDELVAEIKQSVESLAALETNLLDANLVTEMVKSSADLIDMAKSELIKAAKTDKDKSLSCASDVLDLFGICLSAWAAGDAALKAHVQLLANPTDDFLASKLRSAEFFAASVYPMAIAKLQIIQHALNSGSGALNLSVAA